jgi:hypothetical protein
MVLKIVKIYDNGAKHTAYIYDRDRAAYVAKIDAEDATAGLVGRWDEVIHRIGGKRTSNKM